MSNFDENGNYNKTNWKTGDKITADKLNKIEEAIQTVNKNDIERHKEADERLDDMEVMVAEVETDLEGLHAKDEELSTQLAHIEKNVEEFGAVGDGITDDSIAIQEAINNSKKIVFNANKVYYCKNPIKLRQNTVIEGNYSTLEFEENGIELSNVTWSENRISNINIRQRNSLKTGKGIFGYNTYLVYCNFENIYIRGFKTGFENIAIDSATSNLTWSNFNDVRIEYCGDGIILKNGWANTLHFNKIHLHFIDNQAILFDTIQQGHDIDIEWLSLESISLDSDISSIVEVRDSTYCEINISNLYSESLGYRRSATQSDITNFMNNGQKIDGLFYDSKSYLIDNLVYQDDTKIITKYNNNQSIFYINNSTSIVFRVYKSFATNENLSLFLFNNSSPKILLDDLYCYTLGYSYNNIRELFKNLTPSKTIDVYTKQLHATSGGYNWNYGDKSVRINGDYFNYNDEKVYITSDAKFKDIGRGTSFLPLYVETFTEILQFCIDNDKDTIVLKNNMSVLLSETSSGTYNKDATIKFTILGDYELEIQYNLGAFNVDYPNACFDFRCDLILHTTTENNPITFFNCTKFECRNLKLKNLTETSLDRAIVGGSDYVKIKSIDASDYKGYIQVCQLYYGQSEIISDSVSDNVANSVKTVVDPVNVSAGVKIYLKNSKKYKFYDGVQWVFLN